MKNKRDLSIMTMTALLIAIVLFVATGVGTRHQQQAQVQKLEDNAFHGYGKNVRQLVSTTDVLAHEPHANNILVSTVLFCDAATVQTLIDKGVDVNSRMSFDDTGRDVIATGLTALDYAVIHRRADMVEVLLNNGASTNLKTDGQTAIDYLKYPPISGLTRIGTDAQIAHLLRQSQLKSKLHP